ncbi:MAG: GntR family transcriptional regulator [Bifidobacterium sp.]|uniref:GntR family transcriptional regulator n=1 Tax=Bifidobacterium fermentum TaxID=3059035 RepID=A0AB39UM03_9BIFI
MNIVGRERRPCQWATLPCTPSERRRKWWDSYRAVWFITLKSNRSSSQALSKEDKILYHQIYEKIRADIQGNAYEIGSKLPSVKQLCEKYSVSAITIRHALDMLRDEGFITRQPRIGTTVTSLNPGTVAKPTSPSNLPTIAFLTTDFSDSFGTLVLMGALKRAQNRAHILLGRTSADDTLQESEIASALSADADGLILMPSNSTFIPKAILDLISRGFPVTILDRLFQGIPVATISSDNVQAAKEATNHLFDLGHKNVAFIGSKSHISTITSRHSGWAMAYANNDIVLDDELSFTEVQSTIPDSTAEEREDDIRKLEEFITAHGFVTACLVSEYNIALLLREALRRVGKSIPEDMSVICFDHASYAFDHELFRFTHVEQEQKALGEKAIDVTLRQIENGPSSEQILLPTSLVTGNSTAEPRKRTVATQPCE